jgi:hypothetical protein
MSRIVIVITRAYLAALSTARTISNGRTMMNNKLERMRKETVVVKICSTWNTSMAIMDISTDLSSASARCYSEALWL